MTKEVAIETLVSMRNEEMENYQFNLNRERNSTLDGDREFFHSVAQYHYGRYQGYKNALSLLESMED